MLLLHAAHVSMYLLRVTRTAKFQTVIPAVGALIRHYITAAITMPQMTRRSRVSKGLKRTDADKHSF